MRLSVTSNHGHIDESLSSALRSSIPSYFFSCHSKAGCRPVTGQGQGANEEHSNPEVYSAIIEVRRSNQVFFRGSRHIKSAFPPLATFLPRYINLARLLPPFFLILSGPLLSASPRSLPNTSYLTQPKYPLNQSYHPRCSSRSRLLSWPLPSSFLSFLALPSMRSAGAPALAVAEEAAAEEPEAEEAEEVASASLFSRAAL